MSETPLPTLAAFRDMLAGFDWFYDMSDDVGVERAGIARLNELQAVARRTPEHQALFDAVRNWKRNGGPEPVAPRASKKAPARRRKAGAK